MKFLKRIFHAPSSTPNAITLFETGSLPIDLEIHFRQLKFLHHILTLSDNDPVKVTYEEQLKFTHERNWGNEVLALRQKYGIQETDAEISQYTKARWKNIVKKIITQQALQQLNNELLELKHGSKIPSYDELKPQKYLDALQPHQSRKLFHLRAGVIDVKTVRKYWYKDRTCRLCGDMEENVDHIVNFCRLIPRTFLISDLFSNNIEEMTAIAERCTLFASKVKELDQDGK